MSISSNIYNYYSFNIFIIGYSKCQYPYIIHSLLSQLISLFQVLSLQVICILSVYTEMSIRVLAKSSIYNSIRFSLVGNYIIIQIVISQQENWNILCLYISVSASSVYHSSSLSVASLSGANGVLFKSSSMIWSNICATLPSHSSALSMVSSIYLTARFGINGKPIPTGG